MVCGGGLESHPKFSQQGPPERGKLIEWQPEQKLLY